VVGGQYQRVQFTPDLLPSDVTGTYIFDRKTNDFVLRKGPIFCQILLADEINRAPAKTQSALLEAMQENQVTIEGTTLPLPQPFMVMATQNPIEQEGVYRLPEAQLDRFLLRVTMGYPGAAREVDMLKLLSAPVVEPEQLFTPELVLDIQRQLSAVHGSESLLQYIVALAEASREHPDLILGASPRASLCLLRCARGRALLDGRHYFTHEDVQAVAQGVLGHRLIIRPEAEVEGKQIADVVRELLASVPVLETASELGSARK
jgi:MoxR-like ATPase